MTLSEFLDKYGSEVFGDKATAYYQLIHSGSEEVWHTFQPSAKADEVSNVISNVSTELISGKHVLKLVAFASDKTILGQYSSAVQGSNKAAQVAQSDFISNSRAISVHVDTMDKQLRLSTAAREEAEERARKAEERAGAMVSATYEIADALQKLMWNQEEQRAIREESQARVAAIKEIAQVAAPIMGTAVMILGKFLEHKVNKWEKAWADPATNKTQTKEK